MLDSREGRVLGERPRRMFDDEEWEWLEQVVTGDVRHLIVADTLPIFPAGDPLARELERRRRCQGMVPVDEGLRRARPPIARPRALGRIPAFVRADRRADRLHRRGERGAPPSSIVTLGGDIHHAYLARVSYPEERGVVSPVWQAVCSPFRNALSTREERIARAGDSRLARAIGRALSRSAGVKETDVEWRSSSRRPSTIRLRRSTSTVTA